MKRACQTILVGAAILCALILSASSTVALAARVGVPGWAHPFAVGLLEVVAVAGTWIWMTDPRLRLEAAAAVGMASTVTGIGGVTAYGWFGAVGPVGLIVTVHLIARAWTVPAHPDTPAIVVDSPTAITAAVETPAVSVPQKPTQNTAPVEPGAETSKTPWSGRTTLYRLLGENAELLYTGITIHLPSRLDEHKYTKSWWSEVVEVKSEEYPTRIEALAAEREAIKVEAPKYNRSAGSLTDFPATGRRAPAPAGTVDDSLVDRARPLMPAGRPTLIKKLGITDHQARQVIAALAAEQKETRPA